MVFHSVIRRSIKAFGLLLLMCCAIYLISFTKQQKSTRRSRLVPGQNDLCPIRQTSSPHRKESRHRIFFLETSGEPCLTARQACSIESAARANPESIIVVHMELNAPLKSKVKNILPGQQRDCVVTDRLFNKGQPNIELVREDLFHHLKNTTLWRLYEKGSLNQSSYPLMHRSDAVRVAILWKYGGLYLDLDVIVFRPLDCLRNTVGLVDFLPNWVENGVMTFEAGHPFLQFLMKYMVFAFKTDEYISLGPATLTDAIKYFCDRNELPADQWFNCRNRSIILQHPRAFYAINNRRQNAFYHPEVDEDDFEELRYSYLSHIYDAGNGRLVPSESLYGLLAQEFCPTSYHLGFQNEGEL